MESILYHLICHISRIKHLTQCWHSCGPLDTGDFLGMQAIYDLAQHYMYTSPWRRRTMVGQKFHKVISVARALKYRHQSCYESVKVHGSEEIKDPDSCKSEYLYFGKFVHTCIPVATISPQTTVSCHSCRQANIPRYMHHKQWMEICT